MREVNTTNM